MKILLDYDHYSKKLSKFENSFLSLYERHSTRITKLKQPFARTYDYLEFLKLRKIWIRLKYLKQFLVARCNIRDILVFEISFTTLVLLVQETELLNL